MVERSYGMAERCTLILYILILVSVSGFSFAEDTAQDQYAFDRENLHVEIHHCTTCGFRARAEGLKKEIDSEFGVESVLVVGRIGSFDVFVNEELVFSKALMGRFPDSGEVVQLIHDKIDE
jgi:selenoprotein W-related protein